MSGLGTILTAMVTPFNSDGSVDLHGASKLMRYLVDHGSDGLVVTGTTGESPTLDDAEKVSLWETAVAAIGDRATVIAGSGSNDTAHSVELTARASDVGVDAMLVVAPYYSRPPEAGVEAHFRAVADATDKPILLYNIPARCGIELTVDMLRRLGRVENIAGVKQAVSDIAKARAIVETTDLDLYAGDDALLRPFLELGGAGGVCTSSNVVGVEMAEMVRAVMTGDAERAAEMDADLHEVYEALFATSNPILVKAALNIQGHAVGGLRLPLVEADPAQVETIRILLARRAAARAEKGEAVESVR